ncbi:hypothetical protein COBT_002323 [Conglomerata obtusa]
MFKNEILYCKIILIVYEISKQYIRAFESTFIDDCKEIDKVCTEVAPIDHPDNLNIAIEILDIKRKLKLVFKCMSNFILQKENNNYVIKVCYAFNKKFCCSGDDLIMKRNHENICKIYYIYHVERYIQPNRYLYIKCIVMESLMFSLTLDYLYKIDKNYNIEIYKNLNLQQMTAKKLKDILYCLTNAILHLQSRNIVHGDIKPANIMASVKDGILIYKLIDFEGAHTIDLGKYKNIKYTKGYQPPEYIKYGKMHAKSDIWCLGMVAYTLITRYAFSPKTDLFARQKYEYFMEKIYYYINELKLNPKLTDFILSCLIIDPEKRPCATLLLNHQYFRENRPLFDV